MVGSAAPQLDQSTPSACSSTTAGSRSRFTTDSAIGTERKNRASQLFPIAGGRSKSPRTAYGTNTTAMASEQAERPGASQ